MVKSSSGVQEVEDTTRAGRSGRKTGTEIGREAVVTMGEGAA